MMISRSSLSLSAGRRLMYSGRPIEVSSDVGEDSEVGVDGGVSVSH